MKRLLVQTRASPIQQYTFLSLNRASMSVIHSACPPYTDTHTGRHKHAWIKFFQITSMESDLDSIKEWSRSKLSENFRYRMVQTGLKIEFLNQKYLFFSRIFPLRNWEGTPLLPLTEKIRSVVFDGSPYSVMYYCQIGQLLNWESKECRDVLWEKVFSEDLQWN